MFDTETTFALTVPVGMIVQVALWYLGAALVGNLLFAHYLIKRNPQMFRSTDRVVKGYVRGVVFSPLFPVLLIQRILEVRSSKKSTERFKRAMEEKKEAQFS